MLSDVIAALATPPGQSAIALIRVSGREAHTVAGAVLQPFMPEPVRAARLAKVVDPVTGDLLDEAVYVSYSGPASYTGEDMVEISTHGGVLVPVEVLGALLAAGARVAEPGEFTRRALTHGKLDLLQAEAVGDLVAATAPAQRRAALGQLDRGLSNRIAALRDQVLEVEALCCYEIDFPEEDSGPVPPQRINGAAETVKQSLTALLGTATEGVLLREGALCVIAGRPNVGKSSLFNALLGAERAIVTEVPGTTRDAIEAPVTCDGLPFRLIDTAGLRDTDEPVERIGVQVSQRYLAAADVVLLCVEASYPLSAEEQLFIRDTAAPTVVVRTKADLLEGEVQGDRIGGDLAVSAITGLGLLALRGALAQVVFSGLGLRERDEPLITRARHKVALNTALSEVSDFLTARASGVETLVAVTHLRAAAAALEHIIGLVTPEDVLDQVFETFCIGK